MSQETRHVFLDRILDKDFNGAAMDAFLDRASKRLGVRIEEAQITRLKNGFDLKAVVIKDGK